MSTPAHKQRSDYAAGICLTGLLVAAMTAIFAIMVARTAEPTGPEYIITVPISTGVAGIDTSSTLSYGGLQVGKVTSVEFRDNRMEVKVRLNRKLNIHRSVQIVKESSLLGGTTNLVITDLGTTGGTSTPLASGQVIPISDSPSGVSGILGRKGAESIDNITENIESSAQGLRGIFASMSSNDDLVGIRDNYEALASEIQGDLPEWEARYDAIARRVDRIQSKSGAWYDQVDRISSSFDRTDRSFNEITLQLDDVRLQKLKEAFDGMVEATQKASEQFQDSVMPLADELIAKARSSWDDMSSVYATMKDLATQAKDTIDYALAQTTLASQQLTLTIDEVIGSLGIPLLERPSEEEVNLMARYAAMSEWSRSAVQMQELMGSLANMPKLTESGNLEEQATMARMIDLLRASIADYEAAQAKFDQLTRMHQTGSSRRDGVDDQDQ